ncbi:MAG: hypothetical protein SVW02_03445 [Candidatus Nanohaloarchaea archaeon]|nr:hypothetical protein [Candidatus Nanohaloarchaea archaeon]
MGTAHRKIGAKFQKKHAELLEEVAATRGEDMSSFIRRATLRDLARLSYLDAEAKKALGVTGQDG